MASGYLASADITSINTDTLTYTVPGSTLAIANIRLTNRNSYPVPIRVAIGTGGSPALQDYITYDLPLIANGVYEATAITMTAGEKVWIRSSSTGISVRIHGIERGA